MKCLLLVPLELGWVAAGTSSRQPVSVWGLGTRTAPGLVSKPLMEITPRIVLVKLETVSIAAVSAMLYTVTAVTSAIALWGIVVLRGKVASWSKVAL